MHAEFGMSHLECRKVDGEDGLPNGERITCSPDSNAKTYQMARRPGAVKLMCIRRATAPGSHNPTEDKAGKFMRELASSRGSQRYLFIRRQMTSSVLEALKHRM